MGMVAAESIKPTPNIVKVCDSTPSVLGSEGISSGINLFLTNLGASGSGSVYSYSSSSISNMDDTLMMSLR